MFSKEFDEVGRNAFSRFLLCARLQEQEGEGRVRASEVLQNPEG